MNLFQTKQIEWTRLINNFYHSSSTILFFYIRTSDNFVCMDSWFTSFCHASGIFMFKKDSLSTF